MSTTPIVVVATRVYRIMKLTVFAFSLCACGIVAEAAEKIEGAFGLKLGDVWQPKGEPVVSESEFNGGYEFTPEKPNSAFSTYLVFVTPNTHRISSIVAVGVAPDAETAKARCAGITAVLNQKYGADAFLVKPDGDQRVVVARISVHNPDTYCVRYDDMLVSNQGFKEKNATPQVRAVSRADPTGL